MSISAYRRVSTVMNRYDAHGRDGFIRFVTIDPAELEAAWRGIRCRNGETPGPTLPS